jgi:protein-S-isoprenylcysteine O-methyltransferase Ste14
VNGNLYRDALSQLAIGIGGVVAIAIILRVFQSITPTLNNLSLSQIVGVVYILLVLIAVAYVFIAKGAQKMHRLEEL